MSIWRLTANDLESYERDGFFVARSLLTPEETALLSRIARRDRDLAASAYGRADGEGGVVKLALSNELPQDTIYGAIVRSARIVHAMEKLLGGEVYHYHHKVIQKDPKVGGAWTWHQDYGYWYDNGCLFPLLASCMIAIDRATRENGCLQVLRGSHLMGRVNHGRIGDQTGADPERVAAARDRLELHYCELQPGDGVFFHCNLLHRSDQNHSDQPRWAFICCYNAARNDPYKESRHPRYTPLEIWDDDCILKIGSEHWRRLEEIEPVTQ